ncbi:MAG: sulfatase [Dysgonamonadaceae bacterium]|jgi:arylsulfatase A-like enzyme|nr:sulfatase [Dysgonamonadaceae bacterium]
MYKIPICLGAALHIHAAVSQTTPAAPLNILFIMTDDHAFQALSAYGHPISKLAPTPNLDRIAANGMLFSKAYVENSISTPSRATLLTGMYSHQHGQTHLGYGLRPEVPFFTEHLQQAGYLTAVFGKWHLAVEPKGFNTYKILEDQGDYYNPRFKTPDTNGRYFAEEGYVTDLITDHALEWLQNRDDTKPFCLMVHHKAPHRNWMPDLQYLDLYEDVQFPEPATLFDDYATRGEQMQTQELTVANYLGYAFDLKVAQLQNEPTLEYIKNSFPIAMSSLNEQQLQAWNEAYDRHNKEFLANRPEGEALVRWKYQRFIRDYCRTVKSVDVQVGRLLDYLDAHGLTDRTLIVYTSDQGFLLGEHGLYDKRFMYEESFRTPLIIACPDTKKGAVCKQLVQNIDYAPTILDAAGVAIPESMAGKSLLPLLKNQKVPWRDHLYYHFYDFPSVGMVRRHDGVSDGRYKLIHWHDEGYQNIKAIDHWELFDLKRDPTEIHNLYDDPRYDKIRKRLLCRYATSILSLP